MCKFWKKGWLIKFIDNEIFVCEMKFKENIIVEKKINEVKGVDIKIILLGLNLAI